MAVDINRITDGNTALIGLLIDNILQLFARLFGGIATFGNTMGILIGVAFVLGLILVAIGKIKIQNVTGGLR